MATPPASLPPILDGEIQRWGLSGPTELQLLRAALHDAVAVTPGAAGDAPDDVVEKMLIVATELATNALKYGRPPIVVRLCRAGQDYVIDVVDHDPTTQPERTRQHRSTPGG